MSKGRNKQLSESELSAFCEQISLLLDGGISIKEGMYIVCQETEEKKSKSIVKEVEESLNKDLPFYMALEKTGAYPEYMVHMVKIGEETGKMAKVMKSLTAYYEREHSMKESLRNAVFYPLVLFFMMGGLVIVLVVKILPMFQNVLCDLEANVSVVSRQMMDVSVLLGKGVLAAVSFLWCIVLLSLLAHKTKQGRNLLRKLVNHIPYIRKIRYQMGVGTFVAVMSLTSDSEFTHEKSLELALNMVEHPVVNKRIFSCLKGVRNHKSLDTCLKESRLLTGQNASLISVGVKAGEVDTVFQDLSTRYEKQVTELMHEFSGTMEAAVILCLSCVVGLLLLATVLPLVSIISSIG